MNNGIIRSALSTTLALELEYREPSMLREIESEAHGPAELQSSERLREDNCSSPPGLI
jgi:hypothetical protein